MKTDLFCLNAIFYKKKTGNVKPKILYKKNRDYKKKKNRDAWFVCRTMLYAMCNGLLLLSASQSVLVYWACTGPVCPCCDVLPQIFK